MTNTNNREQVFMTHYHRLGDNSTASSVKFYVQYTAVSY